MADQPIPRRKLGRTDMVVTEVSLGGVGLGGLRTMDRDEAAIATVARAWDGGINYLDTSPLYAESERRVGLALKAMGGRPRGLYLSTKTGTHPARRGDYSAEAMRWSVENSLRLLGVSSLDLVLVHDPPSMEPVLAPGAALDTLERMRDEGIFRWIGLGVREHDKLRTAIRTGRFDAILTYADYNLLNQTAASLIDEAHAAGLGVILAQVFRAGLLAGGNPMESAYAEREGYRDEARQAMDWWMWARERGVSLRAIALQFGLRNPKVGTVLVGADTPEQVDQILTAAREPVPLDVWDEVEARIGG